MAGQARKDRSSREASRAINPIQRGNVSSNIGPKELNKITPEWLAAMLLDVTAHLMNAIDKAARLKEPIERIAAAAEASSEARKAAIGRRSRWRAAIVAILATTGLAIIITAGVHSNVFRIHPARNEVSSVAEHRARFGGETYTASASAIERKLKDVEPETIRKYWVEIDGKRFPVKQAVGVGLGAPRATFDSGQAIRLLRKLGFVPQVTHP